MLEYCEIYGCGDATGLHHQIYMDTDETAHPGSVFRMQFCYVHDPRGGANVKSRAERNEIYYNWIQGSGLEELDLIGSSLNSLTAVTENSDVVGNVLSKVGAPNAAYVARIGGDGSGSSHGHYRFANNTVLYNYRVFKADPVLKSAEMYNNVFYQLGVPFPAMFVDAANSWESGRQVAGQNNWLQSGVSNVPPEWADTFVGTDPAFTNYSALNLCPVQGSPLVDGGAFISGSPFGFPDPLFPPFRCPPQQTLLPVGGDGARRIVGSAIDIGAFEYSPDGCCGEQPASVPSGPHSARFMLQPSFPNPARSRAEARFTIVQAGRASIKIYDVQGRVRMTILDGYLGPGDYSLPWNCANLSNGIYQCTLQRGSEKETRNIVVLR